MQMLENQEQIRERENHRVFKQLLGTFTQNDYTAEEKAIEYAHNIKIIPKIFYDDFNKNMKIEFKIGDKQLYKIKNLPEFYTKVLHQEPYQYGTKLNLINTRESFEKDSLPLLEFILKYAEIIKYNNEQLEGYTYYKKAYMQDNIFISNMGLDDLFDSLKDRTVAFQRNGKEKTVYFSSKEPEIPFNIKQIEKNKFCFKADIDVFEYEILEGKDYKYMLFSRAIYRCNQAFEDSVLKILEVMRKNYTNEIFMDEQELTSFFAIIAPSIKNIEKENLSPEIEKRCIPKPLGVKVYFDYDKNNYITADIRFCYEDFEFNPLINQKIEIARNIIKENEALHQFLKTGFMLDRVNSRLILAKEETIYDFLSEEIENYTKNYEVLATEAFKKKEIRSFQIKNLGIRIENNLLEIDLSQIGIDLKDLSEMLEKYQLKKKFYRLKNGDFVKLEDSETMDFLEEFTTNMELEPKDLEKGIIRLPVYRTLYLDRMIKSLKNVEIKKDNSYQNMINKLENGEKIDEIQIPKDLNATLRNYQKVGYKWLKTLDEYNFGGILADDMGLRKNFAGISCYFRLCKYSKRKWKKSKTFYSYMPEFINFKLAWRSSKVYTNIKC